MNDPIALVGAACHYPDARTPSELWENILAGRRAFRRLPDCRLRLADYLSEDPGHPDTTYAAYAALITDYEFDRSKFRVAGSTFRSADMAHWLALDVAERAFADAGFADGAGLPKDQIGVIVGNSLTGEFSRANVLRLRWPYVRRTVESALAAAGRPPEERSEFLESLEVEFKKPFPQVGDETLAGGLSNTIAGRICNYFDLRGGGYTVDGACASSLLAVATACTALVAGDIDVALAGGVDLSLDPFELVGFAKVGALATGEMRVYDARSNGFWPGEGCGLVVLMRASDAVTQGRRIYALVRGWGISSDGHGGITRPEVEGQKLALERAYRRAGFGADSIGYFEGHGTGTAVGDATELDAVLAVRHQCAPGAPRAAIGSIKAILGHTKAAAGVAGLLKATLALHHQVLPPSVGWEQPNPRLTGEETTLELLRQSRPWPAELPLRAAVSAMGFGGINTHVVLEASESRRESADARPIARITAWVQDAEVFFFAGQSREALEQQIGHVAAYAAQLSFAELTDLAAELARTLGEGPHRAAVVASRPAELQRSLETLLEWLAVGTSQRLDLERGVFLARADGAPSVGYLFPGQGIAASMDGGAWRYRFPFVQTRYDVARLPRAGDAAATEIAHPAIVAAQLAGLDVLRHFNIEATVGVGHSLGELAAYHWAGVLDESALVRVATARGRAIAEHGKPGGAMAAISASQQAAEQLIGDLPVVVAGLNSATQTVVSGAAPAIDELLARAHAAGHHTVRLPVSHAFHSPLVAGAADALTDAVRREAFNAPERLVVSTITGEFIDDHDDLRDLLRRQLTSPVRLMDAVRAAELKVDLWVEVGPGHVLRGIVSKLVDTPVVSLDAGGDSLKDLLRTVSAAFVLGAPARTSALFNDRFTRPFGLNWQPTFFVNPCEMAPLPDAESERATADAARARNLLAEAASPGARAPGPARPALEVVRELVARRAELPLLAVDDNDRLLKDLHFTSIAVGSLVADAARALGLRPAVSPTDYAQATVAEIAAALHELVRTGGAAADPSESMPAGVDSWIRPFTVEMVERPLPQTTEPQGRGTWHVVAPPGHDHAEPLQTALSGAIAGRGVALCLPGGVDKQHAPLLLEATRLVIEDGADRFVLVQEEPGAAGWARTLHLEMPHVAVCVVNVSLKCPNSIACVVNEVQAASGYVEAHYDREGTRRVPVLRLLPMNAPPHSETAPPLSASDVLLVTGGGKGIAAECALAVAKQYGVRLGLIGRSNLVEGPGKLAGGNVAVADGHFTADRELRSNLERFTALGIIHHYVSADVTDAAATRTAVREIEEALGPVTAVLHGAGTNVPQSLRLLTVEAVEATLGPKVDGLQNILAAADPQGLRLLITFGSIIARIGLAGEADYALANEWLTALTEKWREDHPHCRCLAVEWSVWSGVGMGERLGRIDALRQQGITPIGPDEGVRILQRLLVAPIENGAVVVSGRFGNPPTLQTEKPALPMLRFLEQPRVYVPGVELVADVSLSLGTDPYLRDHVYQDTPLLPAVVGLEAMAQASCALSGASDLPLFEKVELSRPITVPQAGSRTIRLAALVRGPGHVDVVIRSEETGFQADHFRATCRFGDGLSRPPELERPHGESEPSRLPLEPSDDLYGRLLFHQGRFRRVEGYRQLSATRCVADVSPDGQARWFGGYFPETLLLGDAAVRDAAIHAIQACIPHGTILPVGIDRVIFDAAPLAGAALVRAEERERNGDRFVYDVTIASADGSVSERWEGLQLQRVAPATATANWIEPLLGPYLERRLAEIVPGTRASIAVLSDCGLRLADCGLENGSAIPLAAIRNSQSTDVAIAAALGIATATVHRRPDGKPIALGQRAVSAAHAGSLTISIAGDFPVGCDAEPVVHREPSAWIDLLGSDRESLATLIAQSAAADDYDAAATRLWSAGESLKKSGLAIETPLVLRTVTTDGWVILGAGDACVATWVGAVRRQPAPLAIALLVGSGDEVL